MFLNKKKLKSIVNNMKTKLENIRHGNMTLSKNIIFHGDRDFINSLNSATIEIQRLATGGNTIQSVV